MSNQFKQDIEAKSEKQNNSVLKKISDYSFHLDKETLIRLIPTIGLVFTLSFTYIFVSHYSVKSIRKREDLKKNIKELRSQYIASATELTTESRQSEVAKRLEATGLKELRTPPKKIKKEQKD